MRRAPLVPIAALACACAGSESSPGLVDLRVSASSGLTELEPGPLLSSSAAAALDLVVVGPEGLISKITRTGAIVTLTPSPDSPHAAAELAAALRFVGIEDRQVTGAGTIEVRFADENIAAIVADNGLVLFDLGPYQVTDQTRHLAAGAPRDPIEIRLRARGARAIDQITLVETSAVAEWRMLSAHHIDVIPTSPAINRARFDGLESVRILDMPVDNAAGLYFHVLDPALSAVEVRQALVAALDLAAIARLACGSSACAVTPPPPAPRRAVELPERLSVLVLDNDSVALRIALVVRHQLRTLGVELDVETVDAETLSQRSRAGHFQLLISPLPTSERRHRFFLSPAVPGALNDSGYADPAFDAAVAAGDTARADAILARDLPVVPLYRIMNFAAVDARFCGGRPTSSHSWAWIADLYPCSEGPPS